MRHLLLLLTVLYTVGTSAQISHVSIGYGPMDFPSIELKAPNGDVTQAADATRGGTAYLSIGGENGGGTIFIGGDSKIRYGGEEYGSGMVGLAGFRDFKIFKRQDDIKFGIFAGVVGFQTYQKADLTGGKFKDPNPFPQPELKKTNIQPYGGVRLVIKRVEVQYAPVSNMLTVGVKLL